MKKMLRMLVATMFFPGFLFAQNVGIGTLAPQAKLHVFNTDNTAVLAETNTASKYAGFEAKTNAGANDNLLVRKWMPGSSGTMAGINLDNLSQVVAGVGAGSLMIGVANNSPMYFTTNNIQRMQIAADGNVGIGVVPSTFYRLNVESSTGGGIYAKTTYMPGPANFTSSIVGSVDASQLRAVGVYGETRSGGGSAPISLGTYGVVGTSVVTGYGVAAFGFGGSNGIFAQAPGPGKALVTNGSLQFQGISEADGKVLTSDASGNATWQALPASAGAWSINGTHIYNSNSGNVGIGESNPINVRLLVRDDASSNILGIRGVSPYISFYDNTGIYKGYVWFRQAVPSMDFGSASGSGMAVTISPQTATVATFKPGGAIGFSATPDDNWILSTGVVGGTKNGILTRTAVSRTAIVGESGISGGINISAGYDNNRAAQFLSYGGISTIGFTYDHDNSAATNKAGGWFGIVDQNATSITRYAYVGAYSGGTAYKILGTGAVSTVVKDLAGDDRVMYAPESPDLVFQDYGNGQLENGKTHISFDAILSKNIKVSNNKPLKVFIQLEDECSGVFVSNKTKDGFDVTELNNGKSNAKFSWMIVAQRANEERGGKMIIYENDRFIKAPELSKKQSLTTK